MGAGSPHPRKHKTTDPGCTCASSSTGSAARTHRRSALAGGCSDGTSTCAGGTFAQCNVFLRFSAECGGLGQDYRLINASQWHRRILIQQGVSKAVKAVHKIRDFDAHPYCVRANCQHQRDMRLYLSGAFRGVCIGIACRNVSGAPTPPKAPLGWLPPRRSSWKGRLDQHIALRAKVASFLCAGQRRHKSFAHCTLSYLPSIRRAAPARSR